MRSLVVGACAAVLAFGVGSCGGDEPDPTKPTTAATTTTVSAPLLPLPTPPPGAANDSPQGVTDFVSHYLRVLSWAHIRLDTDELSRLSSPSCSACQSYISAIRDMAADGKSVTGGERSFVGADVRYRGPEEESLVTANVQIGAGTRKDSPSSRTEKIDASTMRLTFGVSGTAADRVINRIFQGEPR